MENTDVVIIGAGAAGQMCAIEAGRRGRGVVVLDHAAMIGEKIRISGGGRCNFTNIHTSPKNFLSQNPHFCVSALKRFTPADFIARVNAHGIAHHEKTLGQLFCDGRSTQIIDMLRKDCEEAGAVIRSDTQIFSITTRGDGFLISTSAGDIAAASLVIATGGKSIPKIGATDFAYRVADQFGLNIIETRPALVPLTFGPDLLQDTKYLSGVSTEAEVRCRTAVFREALLFTHRGVSGPSILQVSSYWREGDEVRINLAPGADVAEHLRTARSQNGKHSAHSVLAERLPNRLAESIVGRSGVNGKIGDLSNKKINALAADVSDWRLKPVGSEGYRTAEVTLGGVDTNELSSKTMEARKRPGLYFVGEAVDVTGWLGGYNFQWAWSSGWAAGQVV
ncbi:MAG: NAD(P)/FAD-dependent oxidoreductase [Pseudomonadota bacterium]